MASSGHRELEKVNKLYRNNLFHVSTLSTRPLPEGVEGTYTILVREERHNSFFAGLYEGIGDRKGAESAANSLHTKILSSWNENDLKNSIKQGFQDFDNELLRDPRFYNNGVTAVVIIIHRSHIYCANLGATKAIICEGSSIVELSIDHHPQHPLEHIRITSAGHSVINDTVAGVLKVSRAFGFKRFKSVPGIPLELQAISGVPDIAHKPFRKGTKFIFLATENLWSTINAQQVGVFIRRKIASQTPPEQILEDLFKMCRFPDGGIPRSANLTAVLILFIENVPINYKVILQSFVQSAISKTPKGKSGGKRVRFKEPLVEEEPTRSSLGGQPTPSGYKQ